MFLDRNAIEFSALSASVELNRHLGSSQQHARVKARTHAVTRIILTPMACQTSQLAEDIRAYAHELGFQQVGFTDVDLTHHEPHVRRWLARGFNGEMGYMARNLAKRVHPEQLIPQTCTVISTRMDYLPAGADPITVLEDPSRAYISRYALGRDYHKVVRRRLVKLAQHIDSLVQAVDTHYRAFTDSAPVLEKALAEKAGLGWIGKHSLLIHPEAGSWFFLGEIYTNLVIASETTPVADQCGACKACMTVCPTDAIIGPKQLDARRCISYLTIEHASAIPEELRPLIGNRVFGCDDCQLYCPWNRAATNTRETDFTPRHHLDDVEALELFLWDEPTFLANTEGSAIRRVSYEQWQRNLAVALGNGPSRPDIIAALEDRLTIASAMVREHIEWALQRLAT